MYQAAMREWWASLDREGNEQAGEIEPRIKEVKTPARPPEDYGAVSMREALSPLECRVMRAFLLDLLNAWAYARECGVREYDVLSFMREWRDTKGRVLRQCRQEYASNAV